MMSCQSLTNVTDSVGELQDQDAPDCWVHHQTQDQELIDAGPACDEPAMAHTQKTLRRGSM
jgi:hypothetical protein